jgi:hypothetical protein
MRSSGMQGFRHLRYRVSGAMEGFGWFNMSYYDTVVRIRLDLRMTRRTRVHADFAAQIGRCSCSNSTAPASARTLIRTD